MPTAIALTLHQAYGSLALGEQPGVAEAVKEAYVVRIKRLRKQRKFQEAYNTARELYDIASQGGITGDRAVRWALAKTKADYARLDRKRPP